MLIFAIFLVWLSLDFLRANIIMGGEGIGGVQWFVRNILEHIKPN